MWDEIRKKYSNISGDIVSAYLEGCKECHLKKNKKTAGIVSKPIFSSRFNERIQIDLIDMQSKPDGPFKFIFVIKDHFTRFLRIQPLEQKTGVAVAQFLFQIFTETGAPTILHTDNGREFRNKSVKSVVAHFPPCKMVHGRPRNSRCQGSVERANQCIQNALITWTERNKCTAWSKALPLIQYMLNCRRHRVIKMSPYKLLFNTDPLTELKVTRILV